MSRTEFELVTARGVPIATYAERRLAVTRAAEVADTYPGMKLIEVTHPDPIRRPIRWDYSRLRLVGS